MPNAIPNALPHALAPLRQPALPDPAHAQRPLTFYLRILRRQWMMIALACAAFTSLVVIVRHCAAHP
jgi:hypothetical protein